MAKKSGNAAPTPVDPNQLIQGQAEANRVNVYSPAGSAVYSGPNKSDLTVSLSPAQAALQGGTEAIQGQLVGTGQALANQLPTEALNFDNLPGQVSQIDTSGLNPYFGQNAQSTQDLSNAVYESTASRLRPEFAQQNAQQEQNLANRGLPINGQAYSQAVDRTARQQNDAYSKAAMDATLAGADLGFQARNQGLGELGMNANLQNQARSQGIGERQALRANPYAELSAILQGSPVQQPIVPTPSAIDVTGPYGMQYAGQQNAYNQSQQNRQANLGGLYGLGAAFAPFAFKS